jgi:hypothetical protein
VNVPSDEETNGETSAVVEKVRSWVHKQGYPLEYRVAHSARAQGFAARQGLTFADEAGQVHEIDVVATFKSSGKLQIGSRLVVECKANVQPWMVLLSEERVIMFDVHRDSAADPERWFHGVLRSCFPFEGELHGVAIVEALVAKESTRPHDALVQVVTAAAATVAEDAKFRGEFEGEFGSEFSFAIPVVVLGGPLLAYRLTSKGQETVEEREYVRLAWSRFPGLRTSTYLVDVVSEQAMDWYFRKVHAEIDNARDLIADNLRSPPRY